jgi:hypothetical protein
MHDVLLAMKDTPLPTILVIAGIFCLLLSVTSQFTGKITIDPTQRFWARLAGAALVLVGIGINYAGSILSGHESADKTATNELNKDRSGAEPNSASSGQQNQAESAAAPSAPLPQPSANRGSYDGRWVADLPAQGSCPAAHLIINVRDNTISGTVANPSGTYPVNGRSGNNGEGTIRINNSDENSGTIRFSDRKS